VGDLSGKHGAINTSIVGDSYNANYVGIGAFFGNRSITVHFANKTRITCANFTLTGSSVGGSSTTNTTGSPTTSTPAQFSGDGNRNAASMLTLMTITGLIFFL
jgi:hypothetical protein